jgi:hypothetical protein
MLYSLSSCFHLIHTQSHKKHQSHYQFSLSTIFYHIANVCFSYICGKIWTRVDIENSSSFSLIFFLLINANHHVFWYSKNVRQLLNYKIKKNKIQQGITKWFYSKPHMGLSWICFSTIISKMWTSTADC